MQGTSFNSSGLIRLLSSLKRADAQGEHPTGRFGAAPDSKAGLTERLAAWMDWTHAIALSTALQEPAVAAPPGRAVLAPGAVAAMAQRLARVRQDLAQAIHADAVWQPGADASEAVDFVPYRQRYTAHQRAMAAALTPLRAQIRALLAARSADGARLAALDTAMAAALASRTEHLLGTVPSHLAAHFQGLASLAADGSASSPWRDRFCREAKAVLLAELDARWQPLEGMMEALSDEGQQ